MKVIKFRGKRLDKRENENEWEYGSLFIDEDLGEYSIQGYEHYYDEGGLQREPFSYVVIPETVGQFLELHDKKLIEVYEGDRVIVTSSTLDGEVVSSEITIKSILDFEIMRILCCANKLEVIGNIH